MNPTADEVMARLIALGDEDKARQLVRFFKTGPGEYGEGDRFLGIRMPVLRLLARDYRSLPRRETTALLRSPWHEARMTALIVLIRQYAKADEPERQQIYDLYLSHTRWINNWDLVDNSSAYIVGAHLADRSRRPLYALARSSSLWERRIAVIATLHFIRRKEFTDTLALAGQLLGDKQDLMHKAVGWMLREVGKKDRAVLEEFLRGHYRRMPRTMLHYAIEKLPERRRQDYLLGRLTSD